MFLIVLMLFCGVECTPSEINPIYTPMREINPLLRTTTQSTLMTCTSLRSIKSFRKRNARKALTLLSIIRNATEDDLAFQKHADLIESLSQPLIESNDPTFIEELRTILLVIRGCRLSDRHKVRLLELLGVYSNAPCPHSEAHRLCFFEPEFRSIAKRRPLRRASGACGLSPLRRG